MFVSLSFAVPAVAELRADGDVPAEPTALLSTGRGAELRQRGQALPAGLLLHCHREKQQVSGG